MTGLARRRLRRHNPDATTDRQLRAWHPRRRDHRRQRHRRAGDDPLPGKYVGIAPGANLVSIKATDDDGRATVLDAIYGLQFAVDHHDDYNIRVVNLSFSSTDAQSYRIDPLDAAVEAAYFHGILVVAAAGNRGTAADAVSYAPATTRSPSRSAPSTTRARRRVATTPSPTGPAPARRRTV